jgi:GntR family transcriptional regulator
MILSIDIASGLPIYLQIIQQIKWRVATGILKPGERLPSVRELADTLRINPNTVAKAFTELEREGIVETRRGSGTFILDAALPLTRTERRRLVREACDRAITDAYHLKWPEADLKALFAERVDLFYKKDDKKETTHG